MKQYCLKFTDEAQAKEALKDYVSTNQWLDEIPVGSWLTSSKDHALDIVGVIHKATGVTLIDTEGNEYPEMAPLEGFHANLAVDTLPVELEEYVVIPETPSRVFAGMEMNNE